MKRPARSRLFALPVLLLASSCTSLSKPFPAKESFGVTIPSLARAERSPVHDAVLRIDRVRIVPPFDQRTFVYRLSDTRYEHDYYAEFIAPPDRLLSTQFIRALASAGVYRSVVDSVASIDTPLRLETTITELSTNFGATPAEAVIRARFLLLNDALHATDLLAEWEIEAAEPLAGNSPAAVADALSRAAARLLAELASKLADTPPGP